MPAKLPLLVAMALFVGVLAPASRAQTLATLTTSVPVSAGAGWVVWSVPVAGGGWGLAAWRDGRVRRLPVLRRADPFDVDVGTDARGNAVVTFTRCDSYVALEPWRDANCRGHVASLPATADGAFGEDGRMSGLGKRVANVSMWRGWIAWSRFERGHDNVAQILVRAPGTPAVRRIRHGAVPSNCPFRSGCAGAQVSGVVAGLDLGDSAVTFRWFVHAPAVVGHGGSEIRVDRLASDRSTLVATGFGGEVCAGGPDGVGPSAPTIEGDHAWFSEVTSECFVDTVTVVDADGLTGRARAGRFDGELLRFAKDGAALYGLLAPKPAGQTGPRCDEPGAPCRIERIDPPVFDLVPPRPRSPFF